MSITSKYLFNLERKNIDLNTPYKTRSRLWKIIITDFWSYWTRKFAVINLKISQLVLVLLAKYGLSAAILKFLDKTWSRFFDLIYFTDNYYHSWKFAFGISKISQLVLELLAKNRFLAAILHFLHKTGGRFIEPIFSTNHYYLNWKFAIKISQTSQLVLHFLAKNRKRPFWIFLTKQEVDFQNQGSCALIKVQPEHIPLEFWKNLN